MADMVKKTVTGKMENYWNKPLPQIAVKDGYQPLPAAIDFAGDYEEFAEGDIEAVTAAKELPTDKELVEFVNAKRRANARQKAMLKALDDLGAIKPTLKNDDTLKLKQALATLMAQTLPNGEPRYTEEVAKAKVSEFLGIDWPTESK